MTLAERSRRLLKLARTHPGRVRAAAVVLVLALVLAAYAWPFLVPHAEKRHLSAYAEGPRDLSAFLREVEGAGSAENPVVAHALATSPYFLGSIRDPETHVLFVFGVEKPYTRGETRAILDFVRAGGRLVLANDVGNANPLSAEFGVVFVDKVVLDREGYKNDPQFPIARVHLGGEPYRVVMNAPVYASIDAAKIEVIAWSSNESRIDVNGNGEIEIGEQPGPFPLVMRTSYGKGEVLLVADTGLFMNEVLALPGFDNGAFVRYLVSGSERPNVLVDESRHVPPPSSRSGDAALRLFVLATSTPTVRAVLAVLAIVVAVAAALLTKDTEDWSVHVFDIGRPIPAPDTLTPSPDRMRALAARAVSERYNIPFEYLDSASVDEIARLTGDRELAAVAKGVERVRDPRSLYVKLVEPVAARVPVQIQGEEVT